MFVVIRSSLHNECFRVFQFAYRDRVSVYYLIADENVIIDTVNTVDEGLAHTLTHSSFPAQNGECFENVRDKSHSLDDREHVCRILPELANITCALQERATFDVRTRILVRC